MRTFTNASIARISTLRGSVELPVPAPELSDRAVAVAERRRVDVDLVLPDTEIVLESALEVRQVAPDVALGPGPVADDLERHRVPQIEGLVVDRRVRHEHVVLEGAVHLHEQVAGPVIRRRRRERVDAAVR